MTGEKSINFSFVQVWCDFEKQYERYTIVGEQPVKYQSATKIKQLPNLSKQFHLQFQFLNLESINISSVSDARHVVNFNVLENNDVEASRENHELIFKFAKGADEKTEYRVYKSVFEGGKWNQMEIKTWKDEDGTLTVIAYLNEEKVLYGAIVEDFPVVESIDIEVNGQIRNFFVYNKYE